MRKCLGQKKALHGIFRGYNTGGKQTRGRVMKLKPSISSIVCWCDGAALAKAVLFAALVFMCGIFVSCGGNSDINNDVIASPEGAWQSRDLSEIASSLGSSQ